jgi:hypothetical protein
MGTDWQKSVVLLVLLFVVEHHPDSNGHVFLFPGTSWNE